MPLRRGRGTSKTSWGSRGEEGSVREEAGNVWGLEGDGGVVMPVGSAWGSRRLTRCFEDTSSRGGTTDHIGCLHMQDALGKGDVNALAIECVQNGLVDR